MYRSEARFGERLEADAFQFLRNRIVPLPGRTDLDGRDLLQQFRLRISLKQSPAREQFVEHHAQAENVRAAIDPMPFAASLFGAHVGRSSREAWSLANVPFSQGQPEIRHERLAGFVEQDVARLDVSMDQPLLVGVVQRLGHRRHQLHGFMQRQPGMLEPRGKVGAVDELGNDEAGELLGAADIMHRHDVGMVQVGDGAGFRQIGFGVLRAGQPAGRAAP